MRRLRGTIRLKSTELWETTTLGYCITLRHRLTLHSHIVSQPQYLPDSACDFWLLPKLKRPLRGTRFESIGIFNFCSFLRLKNYINRYYKIIKNICAPE